MSTDETAPVPVITPFYWNSRENNSVYKVDEVLQGHIELEDDLTTAEKTACGDTTSLVKPKVSGKIVVEGTVYDDSLIGSVTVSFGGSTLTSSYKNGDWSNPTGSSGTILSLTVTDTDLSQDGHSAKWEAVVDTEMITNTAALNQIFTVSAKNAATTPKTSTSSTTQTGATKTCFYKMDVVPYVTQVWTALSEYERTYTSVNNRASTGEYPVKAGETITVYGWNLNNSPEVTLGSETISDVEVAEKSNINVKNGSYGISFEVPDKTSALLNITVNDICALNNKNDNSSHGAASVVNAKNNEQKASADYSSYYNMIPNNQNNNLLTDDVKLDVWDFNTAIKPIGVDAKYVNMKIGPYIEGSTTGKQDARSGRIGFSFMNGSTCFNMPGYLNSAEEQTDTKTIKKTVTKITYEAEADSSAVDVTSYDGTYVFHLKSSGYSDGVYMYESSSKLWTQSWANTASNASSASSDGFIKASHKEMTVNVSGSSSVPKIIFRGSNGQYPDEKSGGISVSKGPGHYVWDGSSLTKYKVTKTTESPEEVEVEIKVVKEYADLYSQTKMGENYQGFTLNTFTFDSNAESYGVALNADTSGKDYISGNLQFFVRSNGHSSSSLNRNYYNALNARRIENTTFFTTDNPDYSNDSPDFDPYRTQSPSMATYIDGDTTYIYVAYFDHGLGRITFRVGAVYGPGKTNANNIGLGLKDLIGSTKYEDSNAKSSEDGGGDQYKIGWYKTSKEDQTILRHRNSTQNTYVGDKTCDSSNAYQYVTSISSITGDNAYVAVGSLSNGNAVITWFDGNEKILKLVEIPFSTLTSSEGFNGIDVSSVEVTSNGGANVAMAIDADDGIHLAYESNSGSDLYYSYLKDSSTITVKDIIVDSKSNVGTYCTIDVGRTAKNKPWIPYISYKSNEATQTKIAYPVFDDEADSSSLPEDGATSGGFFTGKWSVTMLPTSNSSIEDNINVGINKEWEKNTGIIHNFVSDDDVSTPCSATYNVCNSTINYGNGTANPVVGYAIATGAIEMAQKK